MTDHTNEPPTPNIPPPEPDNIPEPETEEIRLPPREDQPPVEDDRSIGLTKSLRTS